MNEDFKPCEENDNVLLSSIHIKIMYGNITEVKRILDQQSESFNKLHHKSFAALALKNCRFDIYEMLISKWTTSGPIEGIEDIMESMPLTNQIMLRTLHTRHLKRPRSNELALILQSRSRISHDSNSTRHPEFYDTIYTAFEELYQKSLLEPILKVVAQEKMLRIVFDFNQTSVANLDPSKGRNVTGASYYYDGFIFIGAKNLLVPGQKRNEVLGTLIHELCHYAMSLTYNNDSKPYRQDDSTKREYFESIAQQCSEMKQRESIINQVYKYPDQRLHAELIVRVPQLIITSKDSPKYLKKRERLFSRLFKFYENISLADLETTRHVLEAKNQVRELNEMCATLSCLNNSSIELKPDALSIDFDPEKISLISSNCPTLTMNVIYKKLKFNRDFEWSYVFTSAKSLSNKKIFSSVVQAFNLPSKPKIIVDCDEVNSEEIARLIDSFIACNIKLRVVMVTDMIDLPSNCNIVEDQVLHFWYQLTESCQDELMKQKVNFQGKDIRLKYLIDKSSMTTIESFPLNDFVKQKIIEIGEEISFSGMEFYVNRTFLSISDEHSIEDVIAFPENTEIMLLFGEPGIGKSTELKMLARKLKERFPSHWISVVDLKEHYEVFHNCRSESIELYDNFEIANFFSERILKIDACDAEIFKLLFGSDRVVLLLDGFDEISPTYSDIFLALVSRVKNLSKNRLWISTRPQFTNKLTEVFQPCQLRIKPLSDSDQSELLSKFFKARTEDETYVEEKLAECEQFIHQLKSNHLEVPYQNPLQTIMVATVFEEDQSFGSTQANIYRLYETFVSQIMLRLMEKGSEARNSMIELIRNRIPIIKIHQMLALSKMFPEESVEPVYNIIDDVIVRIGLLHFDGVSRIEFVDRTFEDYFIANYICENLKEPENVDGYVSRTITHALSSKHRFQLVKIFLNSSFESFDFDDELKSKRLGEIILESVEDSKILHNLVKHRCINLIKFLTKENDEKSRKLWQESDHKGNNVLMNAARHLPVNELSEFYSLARKMFSPQIMKEMLLKTNKSCENALLLSLKNSDNQVFKFMLSAIEPVLKLGENPPDSTGETRKEKIRNFAALSDKFKNCKIYLTDP